MSSSSYSGTTTCGSSYYSSTTSFGNPRTKCVESSSHSGYDRVPAEVLADIDGSLVEFARELGTPIFAGVRRAARRDRRGRRLYRARALAQEVGRGQFETAGRGTGARPREALARAVAAVGAGIRAGQRKKLARATALARFRDRRSSDDTPILFLPGPQPPAASQKTAPAPNFGPPNVPGSVYARGQAPAW